MDVKVEMVNVNISSHDDDDYVIFDNNNILRPEKVKILTK